MLGALAVFAGDQLLGKAADQAIAALLKDRKEAAQKLLLRRIGQGKTFLITDDQAAASIFAFMRAAEEGTARRNLEMMADYLVNFAAEPDFSPNEFRRHALHLSELSRAEALALAGMIGVSNAKPASPPEDYNPWAVLKELILIDGSYFKDEEQLRAACTGLLRTGWVMPLSLYGAIGYAPTAALPDVARLLDIDAAIKRAEDEGVEA